DRGFSLFQQSLNYSARTVTNIGSSRAPRGRYTASGSGGNDLWRRLAERYGCLDGTCDFTFDNTVADNYRPFRATAADPVGDLYNFQPVNYDVTPSRRYNLYTAGSVNISQYVRAFIEGSYVNRNSYLQLAPEPLILGPGGAAVTISRDNLYNPFGKD